MGARLYNLPTEEIAARYNAGESIPQLAAAFECAEGTIMKRLDWAGVVRRPGGKKLSPVAEIVRAYESGQKVEGIARTQTLLAFKAYSRHDLEGMFSVGME